MSVVFVDFKLKVASPQPIEVLNQDDLLPVDAALSSEDAVAELKHELSAWTATQVDQQ